MAVGKQLYDLVHSLTPNEKRHFRLKFPTKSNYLLLFEGLEIMKRYSQEQLLEKLTDCSFSKDLHVTENYLYQRILESLRSYHAEKDETAQLYSYLQNVSLLEERGFYDLSHKMLLKAKRKAETLNNHLLLIDILQRLAKTLAATTTKKLEVQTDEICEQLNKSATLVKEEAHYFSLNQTCFVHYRTWKIAKTEKQKAYVEKVLAQPLLQKFPDGGTFNTQYLFHNTRNSCYSMLRQYKTACTEMEAVVLLWDNNLFMQKQYPTKYIIQISNLITQKLKLNKLSAVPILLKQLEKIEPQSFNEAAELFQNIYYQKLTFYLNIHNFEEAAKLVPAIEIGLTTYKDKINRARELVFYYNVTVLFFLYQKYEKAIHWLFKIQDIKRTNEVRGDVQRFSRILQLAIYYKLGSFEVLEHMFRSIYRKKKLVNALHDFEKIILTYFKKLIKVSSRSQEEQLLFFALKAKLLKLPEQQKMILGFEEFLLWIESCQLKK